MIPDLAAALGDVVDAYTAAGVAAVTDPADLNLPGALVGVQSLAFDTLDGNGYQLTLDVLLIVGDNTPAAQLRQLTDLLTAAYAVLPATTATAATVTLINQSPDPLTALRLAVPVRVTA